MCGVGGALGCLVCPCSCDALGFGWHSTSSVPARMFLGVVRVVWLWLVRGRIIC